MSWINKLAKIYDKNMYKKRNQRINKFLERTKIFVLYLPNTIKEAFLWLMISYLIPIINVLIIWGIKVENFEISVEILSIILVTNACFLTSLFYLAFASRSNRKTLNIITIAFYALTVTLFVIATIEIITSISLFSLEIYQYGTTLSLLVSIILALVSKYDEQVVLSQERAKSSEEISSTFIEDKEIKL